MQYLDNYSPDSAIISTQLKLFTFLTNISCFINLSITTSNLNRIFNYSVFFNMSEFADHNLINNLAIPNFQIHN